MTTDLLTWTVRVRSVMLAVACIGALLAATADPTAARPNGASAKLIEQLSSMSSPGVFVQQIVPQMYRRFGEPDLEQLLEALWQKDRGKYPKIAWHVLEDDEARVTLAQLWGQWLREIRRDRSAVQDVKTEIDPLIVHPELRVRLAVVSFLGSLGDASDIDKLRQIALTDEYVVGADAVVSIADIGGNKAIEALKFIAQQSSDARVQRSAAEALNRMK